MIRKTITLGILAFGSILSIYGCDEVEETIDCQSICQNKRDCIDGDYDVEACRQDCERRTDESESFHDKAHICEACLDGKACAEQITCFDDCPILP